MSAQQARLMIIDDKERIRRLLLDFFEDYDEFALRAFETAEAALAELEREPAEVCIVDVRLPDMDGQSFALAALDRGLTRRCLLHTGSTDFALDESLRARGMSEKDVFLKPCDMADMLARIRELIAHLGGDA